MSRKSKIRPKHRPVAFEPLESRHLLSGTPNLYAEPLDSAFPQGGDVPAGSASVVGFTPAQIRAAYGIDNIKLSGVVGDGTGQTIAIVVAYDNPKLVNTGAAGFASSDLAMFDKHFGIADPPSFTKVDEYGNTGSFPGTEPGWANEASLDVEWTHAIAPKAKLLLVEAYPVTVDGVAHTSEDDLVSRGVNYARSVPGVSVVTMSFAAPEASGETAYDSVFQTPAGHSGVTFVASSGDKGSTGQYPAASPNVLSVGGTTLKLSGNSYGSEVGYADSGGGISVYESKPSYQSSVSQSSTNRTVPDVSFDADRNTGVAVYDSFNGGTSPWYQVGGTSFSAPAWAGLIAIANQGYANAGHGEMDGRTVTLPRLYGLSSSNFHDITSGNNGYNAGSGYDLVTGRGTPIAGTLIAALAGVSSGGSTSANGSISGYVYADANKDGHISGDAGLAGVTMYLDTNKDGSLDNGEKSVTSGSNGSYSFGSLAAGTYRLREVVPGGRTLTTYTSGYEDVTVASGRSVTNQNWGNAASGTTAGTASISGYVYSDTNKDGHISGDPAISGVTLYIDANKNGVKDSGETTATSAGNGYYKFSSLAAGTYRVREAVPSGKSLTTYTAGYDDISLAAGAAVSNINWGNGSTNAATGSVSGYAYHDTSKDGHIQNGESGLSGVTFFIDANKDGSLDNGETSVKSAGNGYYAFTGLTAGTYRIREVVPSNYKLTTNTTGYVDVSVGVGSAVANKNWGNA